MAAMHGRVPKAACKLMHTCGTRTVAQLPITLPHIIEVA